LKLEAKKGKSNIEDFIEIYDETKSSHEDYWLDRIEE
jgi:hypothetical protein